MSELATFFEFCRVVDELRQFVMLNYIGVLKILKKYDKKTGAEAVGGRAGDPALCALPETGAVTGPFWRSGGVIPLDRQQPEGSLGASALERPVQLIQRTGRAVHRGPGACLRAPPATLPAPVACGRGRLKPASLTPHTPTSSELRGGSPLARQCLCAQLIWKARKIAPSAQDFSCPIWCGAVPWPSLPVPFEGINTNTAQVGLRMPVTCRARSAEGLHWGRRQSQGLAGSDCAVVHRSLLPDVPGRIRGATCGTLQEPVRQSEPTERRGPSQPNTSLRAQPPSAGRTQVPQMPQGIRLIGPSELPCRWHPCAICARRVSTGSPDPGTCHLPLVGDASRRRRVRMERQFFFGAPLRLESVRACAARAGVAGGGGALRTGTATVGGSAASAAEHPCEPTHQSDSGTAPRLEHTGIRPVAARNAVPARRCIGRWAARGARDHD